MQIILIEPIAKTLERSRDFWSNGHLAQRQLFKSWSRSYKELFAYILIPILIGWSKFSNQSEGLKYALRQFMLNVLTGLGPGTN